MAWAGAKNRICVRECQMPVYYVNALPTLSRQKYSANIKHVKFVSGGNITMSIVPLFDPVSHWKWQLSFF